MTAAIFASLANRLVIREDVDNFFINNVLDAHNVTINKTADAVAIKLEDGNTIKLTTAAWVMLAGNDA
jgi:hypothetical protein